MKKINRLIVGGIAMLLTAALLIGLAYLVLTTPLDVSGTGEEPPVFRTDGNEIQLSAGGRWTPFSPTGVNIGTGYPGIFPNETGISPEIYQRWFRQIGEMNANTIRVYKLQTPEFYQAFLQYNQTHDQKLYLLQGVDFSEHLMFSDENILDPNVYTPLFEATRDVINAVHGDAVMFNGREGDLQIYSADISDYLMGYILGIEWDEWFTEYTCRINKFAPAFTGTYLSSSDDANAFEKFLARWGDFAFSHEEERYRQQHLISFANWPDTDPFINKVASGTGLNLSAGSQANTEATIDIEHIHCSDQVRSGLFVSYNVYPYFPAFLQWGPYTYFRDSQGRRNPYLGYLTALFNHHSYPVLISEYGTPSSRSVSFQESWQGYSHGGLDEKKQGEAVVDLYHQIMQAGCAGSLTFSWQDEWYKSTWNEKLFSDPDGRASWSNAQSPEQFFGVLSFDPGPEGQTPVPDGVLDEWSEQDLVMDNGGLRLHIQSDAKYMYFMIDGLDGTPVDLALDITPKSGVAQIGDTLLDRNADFILRVDGKEQTALYVDHSYDLFPYSVFIPQSSIGHMQDLIIRCGELMQPMPGNQDFILVQRSIGDIHSRLYGNLVAREEGRLKYGNANPDSPDYDSNADFCFAGDDAVELRVPWQLLNFHDPSKRTVIDDLVENDYSIRGLKVSAIYAAVYAPGQEQVTDFGSYKLKSWDKPEFHERLKPAYYALQKAFGEAVRP